MVSQDKGPSKNMTFVFYDSIYGSETIYDLDHFYKPLDCKTYYITSFVAIYGNTSLLQ